MSSTVTPTLSSPGIGSGLDINGIVSKLMSIESQPMTKLQTEGKNLQTQLSAVGQLQSLMSSFQDAVKPLTQSSSYQQTSAVSSDSLSVGASTGTGAVTGTYSVNVSAVASAQTLVSAQGQFTASTDTVGTGSITLRLGTWNAGLTSFTPQTGSSDVVIPIDSTKNTLAGIRDAINAANAGVTASIVTDSSGARLALASTATGAANGFRVTVSDDDGNNTDASGLSRLAYDPANSAAQMTRAQAAADTSATINRSEERRVGKECRSRWSPYH